MQTREEVWLVGNTCESLIAVQEYLSLQNMIARPNKGILIVLTGERGSGKSAIVDV
jgi:tRNA(Met) C34 N-acetyltransferase TmcA